MRTIPNGNTAITWGMIHIPVSVAKATVDQDVKFDRVGPSGGPINRIEIDSITKDKVEADQVLKGIKTGNEFKVIDQDALNKIEEETKLTSIQIEEFADADTIARERVTGAYYLQTPNKQGNPQAMNMLCSALQESGKVAIGKWTASSRQKLVVIWPRQDGALVMNTVSFRAAWQEPDDQVLLHLNSEISEELMQEALKTIAEKTGDGSTLDLAYDEAIIRKKDLVERALAGESFEIEAPFVPEWATQTSNPCSLV